MQGLERKELVKKLWVERKRGRKSWCFERGKKSERERERKRREKR